MLNWLWILFASNICGQTSFEKTDGNEIFDVTFRKFISEADLPSFSSNNPLKFGTIKNQPDDGIPGKLKKSDGINNQDVLGKKSFENNMMAASSSETMPEKITLPASDGSLMIGGEKTIEEIAEEFRKDETQNTASIKINQMNDSHLQVSASEMSAFLHSVTDRDAVEKLVRDSNLIPAKEHSNLSEPPIENMLDFITFDTPVSNLKTVTVTNHTTLNDLDYPVEKVPDSFIIWSDPQIFIEPIHIAKFNFGQEILSVKAHDTFNSSIEFICMLPEFVFCVTDLLSNESYQLRMFYTGTSKIKNFSLPLAIRTRNRGGNSYASFNASIHFVSDDSNMNDEIRSEISSMTTQQTVQYQVEATIENELHVQPNFIALEDQSVSTWNGSTIQPEEATRKPETPVFIFMPHFEQNNYEIYVPEGKNKNSIIVAIIYFLTYPSDAEAKFSIQSEPLQWFYLGEMEAEMNANRLIVAIKLMLHDGADVDFKKTNNGHYKFQIKANQGSFETSTNINVEVLAFATKETFYSSDMITISSANLTSLREKFTTPRVLADSEHHTAVHFTDISDNESRIITATVSNMEQIDINTATASGSSDIKITQTELAKDTLETTEESPVRKNFAETFQSTEAITKIAKSAKEKGSERFSILTVNEIARYPSESTMKEPEITPVTLPEIFENDDSSHSEIDNLDTVHNTSVSSERRTSTISETHDNALAMEISQSSKRIEFNENMDNFSSYNQEELVAKKSTTIVVSSIRYGSNLFPNVPVGDGKSLHDEFGASLMSMTTISAPVNDGDIDNMQWSSSQDNKQYDENFQKSTENLKTSTNIKQDFITTTETTNLMIHELNKNAETDAHFVDDDTSYAENDIYTGVENDYHTSTYINVTWKNRTDNISTITNNADTTVPSSEMTETVSIDRSTNAAILQQTSISLTDNIHMNSNNEMNRSWNQSGDENFGINKSQRIHLAWQQTSSDKTTTATVLHSETSRIETEAKSEWPEEDESLENGFGINKIEPQETMINVNFKINKRGKYILPNEFRDFDILPDLDIIITANNMDPNDVIMVSVNSSALEIIPRRMQPGKTVFLVVRDAEKLDRDLLDGSIVIKVTASQRKHPSVTSSKVISIMRNENLSNEAPAFLSPEYDFHVNEGSITGQKVGQMEAEFMDHREHGIITYQLIGSGSELFAINGGTISVSCPSVLPCLDREQTITYHLLAIATNRNGLNSVPAIVRIHIVDRNDNGPILETLQNAITVFNGRLTKPFVVKVKDNDVTPHDINEISIDGTASAFISLEKVRDDIYYGRLWSLPAVGIYELNITARDPDGSNPEQKITVIAQVLNAVTRAHFERAKYERTINTEKLFKGNLILQPKLENAPLDALRFVLLRNDPGWLSMDEYSGNVIIGDVPQTDIVNGKYSTSIAAVNRTDGRLVTESVLVLTVISDNHVKEVFTKKLIVKTLRKDTTINRQAIEVLPEQNKASITIVRDSINAFDEQLHYVNIDENAISIDHGLIIIDMKRLQQIRMLQFNLFSKEDTNDSAKVMLFLSSEPIEMEHERKRQAQPRFSHPWRSDMNIIPIKLAENSSEGYTIISLPAYNPMDGTKIIDLRLSGEMAQHFTVDGRSGDVQVVIPFDFEAMEPESHIFDLQLIAGEEPYDTVAVLRVEIIDIDDNPPKIAKIGDYNFENLTIAENSRPGTVLFEVQISDPDYLYGKIGVFSYALSGNGAANFQVKKVNDTVAVIVSPAADLDREKIEEMIVLLKVTDSGGNSDSVAAMITIIDVNDNVPVFIHSEYKIEAVENWPEAMILTYVHAEDNDNGLNADIRYSLSPKNNEYFEIDPIRGLIHTKKALIGLARAHPYDFSVVASDQGSPSLSASTAVSIHVLESTSLSRVGDDKGIHIVSPSVHFTLLLDENTPANDRVYSVQAKIGGFNEQFGREIKYSITPVDNAMDGGWFTIDTNSGDLFTLQELDYELQSAITLKVKAENAIEMDKTATRLLRIEVNDVNDNLPIFSEIHSSVPLVFMIQSGNTVVGQLKAVDIDDAPYNSTYYYMLPSCSNRDGIFTVDKQTGVVSVTNFNDLKYDEYHLCALASAFNMSKIPEIAFDSNNASMMAFTVRTETNNVVEQMNKMKHLFENHTVSVFGIDSETTIPVTRLKSHQPTITYQLGSMRFTPAENEEISKESAPYFTIDSVSGDIRIDPMLGDYTEGVFTFDIVATQQRTTTESIQIAHIVKQVHNVKFPSLLKFIFDQNVHLLGLNLEDFNQHLHNALKLEPALSDISVIFGIPHVYESAGRNRSSVCFHTLRNGVILRQENAISALSATLNGGGTLSRLYQVFKVANIEPCIEVTRILSSGLMISRSALFWTGFSLVGILILISFCIYACFIIRYKNYLNMKKASLVGETSSATVSIKQPPSVPFYSINNLPTLDY